uniref:non-specific serine/threonine protein kinase n=1 Tax=Gouania willdenowi TaxID=441366 RepID=A0A8C5ND92_GOUWI
LTKRLHIDNFINFQFSKNEFKAKYEECQVLGEGSFGTVYAGIRRSDLTQVAVKHIPKEKVTYMWVRYQNSFYLCVSEVILMAQAAGLLYNSSDENRGIIGLIDVYDLEEEVLIVMERPQKSMDISKYIEQQEGQVTEHKAKSILKQLVDAALLMHNNGIFHQDIKDLNVLVSPEEDSLPIRIIDFGCSDFVKFQPYSEYNGTLSSAPPEVLYGIQNDAELTTVWQIGSLLKELFEHQRHILKGYSFLSQECIHFMNQWMQRQDVFHSTGTLFRLRLMVKMCWNIPQSCEAQAFREIREMLGVGLSKIRIHILDNLFLLCILGTWVSKGFYDLA